MHNSTAPRLGQRASRGPRTRKHAKFVRRKVEEPHLIIRIGRQRPRRIPAGDLSEQLRSELVTEFSATNSHITIEIAALALWPDDARYRLFNLVRELARPLTVRINDHEHTDPFEAVLAALPGPQDMTAHAQSIKAALEAAALFHGQFPHIPAGRINARIAEVGGTKPGVAHLAKRIHDIAGGRTGGGGDGDGDRDPREAAAAYIHHLRESLGLEDTDQPVLLCYRSEYYAYDGRAWRRISDDQLEGKVTKFAQDRDATAPTHRWINDVMINLRGLAFLDRDHEDMPFYIDRPEQPPMNRRFIAFANGMLDIEEVITGEPTLYEHDSRWFSLVALPYDYDPHAKCPGFLRFLRQVLPRSGPRDLRRLVIQRYMGYLLLPDCRYHKMLIAYGSGRNGKSVLLVVCTAMLGDGNVAHVPFDNLGSEFRLTPLLGKAANITMELNHIGRTNEALLKNLTSGEPININRKYRDPIDARPFAKLLVGTNDLPVFTDNSNGMWARLIEVPFEVVIPDHQANRMLAQELKDELPGICNWAILGLRRLLRYNRFPHCARCATSLAEHRRDCDSVADFLHTCCQTSSSIEIPVQRLYEIYRHYCQARERRVLSVPHFGARFKRLGIDKRRGAVQADGSRPWAYRVCLTAEGREWEQRYVRECQPGWQYASSPAT